MNKLDDNTTKSVAGLIKIKIPDADLPKYTSQLNTVLESVEVLKELDTESVKETSQTHGLTNVIRADEPTPGLDLKKYKNRRNFSGKYFTVKKVL